MTRAVLGTLLAAAALLLAGPAVAEDSAEVTTAVEAWFRGSIIPPDSPICVVGCPPVSFPEAPYPDDTLHVGVAGGFETARTYITLDLADLPPGRVITGGTVHLPLAGVEDGTTAEELADIVACAVNGIVEPAHGGPADQAPAVGCTTAATVTLDAEGGAFTFDLAAFATGLPAPDELAVALVASEDSRGEGGTWRAVFHGRDRDAEAAEPITARVTFTSPGDAGAAPAAPAQPATAPPSAGVAQRLAPPAPQQSELTQPLTPAPEAADTAEEPAAAPAEEPTVPAEPVVAALPSGYAYPQVWLLPLVFLAVGGVLARSLGLSYEVAPRTEPGPAPS